MLAPIPLFINPRPIFAVTIDGNASPIWLSKKIFWKIRLWLPIKKDIPGKNLPLGPKDENSSNTAIPLFNSR